MNYSRIEDLPANSSDLASPELAALATVWRERKGELEGTGEYEEFVRRLRREWAIETGLIERLYTWDRGVTEVLIEQGISEAVIAHHTSRDEARHAVQLISDQHEIVEGLFAVVKQDEPLTESFVRSLQARFTAHQETVEAINNAGEIIEVRLKKGDYKDWPNNPRRPDGTIHPYCPPELVREEMPRLVEWYRAAEESCAPEVLSAWLHHRFTQIHPFQDGNGRVARALASLVFLRAGLFPLVVRDSDRMDYIAALESADSGDLKPLVVLFAKRQKDAILHALGLEQQVQRAALADEIIAAAVSKLKQRGGDIEAQALQLKVNADRLCAIAADRIATLKDAISAQIRDLAPFGMQRFMATERHALDGSEVRHYFQAQIIDTAKSFDYFADLGFYRSWARMAISTKSVFEFVVSLHGFGHIRSGVIVASAFSFKRVPREEGGSETVELKPACDEVFQFNYAEPQDSVEKRFREWLETSIAIGLTDWKRTLEA